MTSADLFSEKDRREAHLAVLQRHVIDKASRARAIERDPQWRDRAACVGSSADAFFPLESDAAGQAAAKRVCGGCPVRDDCLAFATAAREDSGVWGGLSAAERRSIKRRGVGHTTLARRSETAA